MIIKTCKELNQQEYIKHDYYSLVQTTSIYDFSFNLLFLAYYINFSLNNDTIYDYFKQDLKNYVLNKFNQMSEKSKNL